MKKILLLLFSLFFLSSPSVFADDISDFQIEGISVGDNLLDYMSEDEILEGIELTKDYYSYLKEPNKYAEVYLFKDLPTYDFLSFFIKNNAVNQYVSNSNEKYPILFVRGLIDFIEDFDGCIRKRDEIAKVISEMFPDAQIVEDFGPHPLDSSGDSIIDSIVFKIDSGTEIESQCNNWEETFRVKNNYSEGLSVVLYSEEVLSWITDY